MKRQKLGDSMHALVSALHRVQYDNKISPSLTSHIHKALIMLPDDGAMIDARLRTMARRGLIHVQS